MVKKEGVSVIWFYKFKSIKSIVYNLFQNMELQLFSNRNHDSRVASRLHGNTVKP